MPENHKSLSLSFIFFERKKKASDRLDTKGAQSSFVNGELMFK
jgi:hypothetical protein